MLGLMADLHQRMSHPQAQSKMVGYLLETTESNTYL